MANEKRLIDANALMKQFYNYYDCVNEFTSKNGYRGDTLMDYEVADMIYNCIADAPTVDAVEVVRCKNCKHKTVTADGMVCECALPTKRMMDYYIYGSTILARVEPDAFCSYGERREGE